MIPVHYRKLFCATPFPLAQSRVYRFSTASDTPSLSEVIEFLGPLGTDETSVQLHLPGDLPSSNPLSSLENTACLEVINPSARNALNGKMMVDLAYAVHRLENLSTEHSITSVILQGHGNWFCAGADLTLARTSLGSTKGATFMNHIMVDTLTRLRNLPMISVALIEGAAIGGGAELATACDFRILHENAYIRFVHSKMGLTPGWGAGSRLVKLIGRQKALIALGTSKAWSSNESAAIGLADKITQPGQSVEECGTDFLAEFHSEYPEVLQGMKAVVANADDQLFGESLEMEKEVFVSLWGGPANSDALSQGLNSKGK